MISKDSIIHALVGAVVTTVVFFVPLSPVIGGAVAAYLGRTTTGDGIRVGAISGVIATIPMALVGLFGVSVLSFAYVSDGFLLLIVLFGVLSMLYTVGLSALGGFLGAYLVDEFENARRPPETRTSGRDFK
jgi:Family of unknown function (DUF5518)